MSFRNLKIVLHIGYHKTGTTFLQKSYFPYQSEILYIGRSWLINGLEQLFYDFSFCEDIDFNASKIQNRFYSLIEEYINANVINVEQKKMLLISHESLHSGSDYFGSKIKTQLDRIKKTFPEAHIIIGIRNQIKMIESHYTNYIHHGGKLNFNKFFNSSKFFNKGLKRKLEYDVIINLYRSQFGVNNVHVLVFEEVFSKPLNFGDLSTFLGINEALVEGSKGVNKRLSSVSIFFLRQLNKIMAKNFNEQYSNRLSGNHSKTEKIRWFMIRCLKEFETLQLFKFFNKNYLTKEQIKNLEDYYKCSNKSLSELTNKDLIKVGYKC